MKKINLLLINLVFFIVIIPLPATVFAENIKALANPGPILNDMRIPGDYYEKFKSSGLFLAPSFYETSEYMYGDISVAIILPESNGAIDPETEDWTQEEIDNVHAEISDGLNWWITNKHSLAEVSFTYHYYELETSYEPINGSSDYSNECLWINEMMDELGQDSGECHSRVRSFDNDLRNQDNSDWAFTVFVVDSSNDADGYFTDGYFAYAYRQGPFTVMTYTNNGYGINNMDAVTAHETGHIFGAADEYSSASSCYCEENNNFLNVQNQNCVNSCLSDVAYIQRSQVSPYTNNALCDYTKGQIGWRDLDGDSIIDSIDSNYNTDSDTDSDGIVDYWDNCPLDYNPTQEDADGDGIGDACDICPGGDDTIDTDGEGVPDFCDNCPNTPNSSSLGTCVSCNNGVIGSSCTANEQCSSGYCSMDQEDYDGDNVGDVCDANVADDNYPPPSGNDCTDACECEGNFDYDLDVDGTDTTAFLADLGRYFYNDPCIASDLCNGDFDCDGDVDGADTTKFLEDLGRYFYNKPCPQDCQTGEWCSY